MYINWQGEYVIDKNFWMKLTLLKLKGWATVL